MGVEAEMDFRRSLRQQERRASIKDDARRIKIGGRIRRIRRLGRIFADEGDTQSTIVMIGEYLDAEIVSAQRILGHTTVGEILHWKKVNNKNPDTIRSEAKALFDYRHRLTTGDGAITVETFQHALNKNPDEVLSESLKWSEQPKINIPFDELVVQIEPPVVVDDSVMMAGAFPPPKA